MKNIFTKPGMLVAAGLALFAMSVPANAYDRIMRIDIPFSFVAGEQTLPAGTYRVRVDSDHHTVDFNAMNETKTSRILLHDSAVERRSSGNHFGILSFKKYGGTLVLKGVYAPGAVQRWDLPTTRIEKELARTTSPAAVGEATLNLQ